LVFTQLHYQILLKQISILFYTLLSQCNLL
jgi:hypothetical protein